jgi:hypothetical protein
VHTRTTQWLTAITAAALLLTASATTATARNLSTSEQSFRATFTGLEFTANAMIRCRVTLEGSFHSRTIPKVARTLVGAITRAIVGHPCTGGGEAWADNGAETQPLGTAPNRLPYHITYESFSGTLPAIRTVNLGLSRASFVMQVTVLGLTCRGRYGNATDSITTTASVEAGGAITALEPHGGASLVEELGPNRVCRPTLNFSNTGGITNLSTGARLTVTLI